MAVTITLLPNGDFEYDYPLTDTPNNAADPGSLSQTIHTSLPADPLVSVSVVGPTIEIVFPVLLPAADLVTLNGIIASTPGTPQPDVFHTPAWFIDPAGGSDDNMGTTQDSPLQSYGQLVSRWGTNAPLLYQDTLITFMSDQPDLSDPVAVGAAEAGSTAGILTIAGSLSLVAGGAGSFTAVTPKNRATDTRWGGTDAAQPANFWAAFVGFLVHDTTVDAWFWVEEDLGGTSARFSEPLASAVGNPNPPMVAIGIGDNYEIVRPTRVNVTQFSPQAASGNDCELRHLWFFGAGGTVDSISSPLFTECRVDSFYDDGGNGGPAFGNCYLFGVRVAGGFFAGGVITFEISVVDGDVTVLDGDILVDATAIAVQGTLVVGAARFANSIDVPNLSSVGGSQGSLYVTNGAIYGVAALWGPGAVNGHVGGDVGYSAPAVGAFLQAGGLTLDGVATATGFNPVTGLWTSGIALSPAALDAAPPGGFGSVAYGALGTKIRTIA